MDKAKKILAPILAAAAAAWNAFGAYDAFRTGHWFRGAFDVLLAVVFVLVAYTLFDTGKRFSDS
jgi:chromate transport protein ChrA